MQKYKILVVDDDTNVCKKLKFYLEKEGYSIQVANNGKEAINLFQDFFPNLILLDILMPKMNGWEVCKFIKKQSNCFIIMMSAKCEVFDRILGLELGADDYISKPFEVREVVARVKAVLRRSSRDIPVRDKIFKVSYDKLIIDIKSYTVFINGNNVKMPPKELELLFFLSSQPNKVFKRDELLDQIWGEECYVDMRTVDVHIKRLRDKLTGISDKWVLKTVWGVGYKFETY